MKIYSMTATFGKLEHETLRLEPGLNILEAPNEWGKSTWCAFLVNMLYGIETRAKTTKMALADKERYAPWSGAPMAGRIDLSWNGRDITIERRTKGRLVFGEFQAYETATGIEVPELNGANCGQQLLGVERSVFTRAGFLKLSDLPVTQDDSLRRRLNNLVTTGDESGAGDKLAQTLKDLKNKCRYNRSGLLPQAESERDQLRNQLDDLYELQNKAEEIRAKQAQLEKATAQLENHKNALEYAASIENAARVEAALAAQENAQAALEEKTAQCAALPTREEAVQKLQAAQKLQDELLALQMEAGNLPVKPAQPDVADTFCGVAAAEAEYARYKELEELRRKSQKTGTVLLVLGSLLLAGLLAAFLLKFRQPLLYLCGGGVFAVLILLSIWFGAVKAKKLSRQRDAIGEKYPGLLPERWVSEARAMEAKLESHRQAMAQYDATTADYQRRRAALDGEIAALCGEETLKDTQLRCQQTLAAWDALGDARRELLHAQNHAQALQAMIKPVAPAQQPDSLTLSNEETERYLTEARFAQRQLQLQLGQCMGQAEALGQESQLKARLELLNRRIARLEDTYYALEMAQDALREATTTLQRRFAPRISKRAQELFSKLTGGRYQRITLDQEFNLHTSAEDEDTLRSSQWRSDGTVDQLYLALRLAVAEELTPEAPLVLDDALVRFDDERLKVALEILRQAAENKQVILFTCQSREKNL